MKAVHKIQLVQEQCKGSWKNTLYKHMEIQIYTACTRKF